MDYGPRRHVVAHGTADSFGRIADHRIDRTPRMQGT